MNVLRVSATAAAAAMLMLLGVVVALPASAGGQTYVVTIAEDRAAAINDCNPAPRGDPATGCSLREAIIAANLSLGTDMITFDPALLPNTFHLTLSSGSSPSGQDWGDLDILDPVTIDGQVGGQASVIITADGLFPQDRVIDIASGASGTVLRGLDISDGYPTVQDPERQTATLDDLDGGGIRAEGDQLALEDVRLSGNAAQGVGGGIAWYGGGTLSLTDVTVGDNAARAGGGVFARSDNGATLSIQRSTLIDNALLGQQEMRGSSRDGNGGGLYADGVVLDMDRTGVIGNGTPYSPVMGRDTEVPTSPVYSGGGMYLRASSLDPSRITESLFRDNTSLVHGGGMTLASGEVTIEGTTLRDNTASGSGPLRGGAATYDGGGAIHAELPQASARIINSTISGNTASTGAAIRVDYYPPRAVSGSSIDLVHVTVADNTTTYVGADIEVTSDVALSAPEGVTFYNSILQSSGTVCEAITGIGGGGLWSYDGNANPDGSCLDVLQADDVTGEAAVQDLEPFADNGSTVTTGGSTQWEGDTEVVQTRELAAGAEGVDTAAPVRGRVDMDTRGVEEHVVSCEPGVADRTITHSFQVDTDQRGFTRPVPAGDPGPCDRGAFERQATPTTPTPGSPSRDVSLAKTGPTMAAPGDEITYTLTATNTGATATGVTITDPLAAGAEFVGASSACDESGGTVTCAVGSLAGGQSVAVTITVAVEGEGSLTNTACVDAAGSDTDASNDCATHVVDVDDTMRVEGPARVETAVAGAQAAFEGLAADAVVLSRQDAFPDSQVGTPLAIALNAPMLLSQQDVLSTPTEAEILRVLPIGGTVYLLGGESALSAAVEERLGAIGYVPVRLAGVNRFETAAVVAEFLGNPADVLVADGADFRSSIIAGAAATQLATTRGLDPVGAVLLSDGERMPAETQAYLDATTPRAVTIGAAAGVAMPGADEAIVADGPAGLSVAVAERFFSAPTAIGVATDADFPDGLIGGAIVNLAANGPMLLTPPDALAGPIADYLAANLATVSRAFVFGGPAALAPQVEDDLDAILFTRR